MAYFPGEAWVAFSVIGAAGIIGMLHVLASRFQHERDLHDLRVRATELRTGYAQRVAALRARERGETPVAEVVGVIGPDGELRQAA